MLFRSIDTTFYFAVDTTKLKFILDASLDTRISIHPFKSVLTLFGLILKPFKEYELKKSVIEHTPFFNFNCTEHCDCKLFIFYPLKSKNQHTIKLYRNRYYIYDFMFIEDIYANIEVFVP